jgi:hypothetical protein
MKPLVVILGIFVAAAAGAAGGMLAGSSATPAAVETADLHAQAAHVPSAAAPAASARVESAGLAEQVHQLSDEVTRLQAELAAIREGRVREVAVAKSAENTGEVTADDLFAAQYRGAILRVIDEDRALQAQKAEDERRAKESIAAQQRAERNAKELGLSTTQTRALADFYVLESDKRNEFFKDFRNGNVNMDRDQARTAMTEFRDWRTTELTTRLGADNVTRLNEIDGDRGPGFAGGRAFGGDGNAAGGAPGATGNRRRNNNGGANGNNAGGGNGGSQTPGTNPGGF